MSDSISPWTLLICSLSLLSVRSSGNGLEQTNPDYFFPKHILKNKISGIVFIGFYSKDLDEEYKSARTYNGNGGLSASCPISWFGIKTEVKRNYKRTK